MDGATKNTNDGAREMRRKNQTIDEMLETNKKNIEKLQLRGTKGTNLNQNETKRKGNKTETATQAD